MGSIQDRKLVSLPDDQVEIEERVGSKGVKYIIRRPKGSSAKAAEVAAAGAEIAPGSESKDGNTPVSLFSHGNAFQRPVNWPVGSSGNTDDDFHAQTGIYWYSVSTPGIGYKYMISFWTDQTYDYHFQDQTGQLYENNVFLTDHIHETSYDSQAPNIVAVFGA